MKTFVFVSCLLACSLASADVLWGKTETGQSVENVQELYPNGKVVQPTKGNTLKSGAAQRYTINDIDVNGDKFLADLYFKENALDQVTLKLEANFDRITCDAKYSALHALLSGKYGAPVSVEGKRPSLGITKSTFSSGTIAVNTFAMTSPNACSLMIFYMNKATGAAANL